MTRLRTVSPASRGWSRRRAGKGFVYLDAAGTRLAPADAERIRSLAIPPAWHNVWICPRPDGHIQAVGTDVAGRRQYLYHPEWRSSATRRSSTGSRAAQNLPRARKRSEGPGGTGMPPAGPPPGCPPARPGYFRIGSDAYTEDNGSFGLTTLERHHVSRKGDVLVFRFVGKSGIEHTIEIDDTAAIEALDRSASDARRASDSWPTRAARAGPTWTPRT